MFHGVSRETVVKVVQVILVCIGAVALVVAGIGFATRGSVPPAIPDGSEATVAPGHRADADAAGQDEPDRGGATAAGDPAGGSTDFGGARAEAVDNYRARAEQGETRISVFVNADVTKPGSHAMFWTVTCPAADEGGTATFTLGEATYTAPVNSNRMASDLDTYDRPGDLEGTRTAATCPGGTTVDTTLYKR